MQKMMGLLIVILTLIGSSDRVRTWLTSCILISSPFASNGLRSSSEPTGVLHAGSPTGVPGCTGVPGILGGLKCPTGGGGDTKGDG